MSALRLIVVALLLAGCDGVGASNTIVRNHEPGPTYYVHDVTLDDGTRCVVSTSGSRDGGTGIACDFRGERVEQ